MYLCISCFVLFFSFFLFSKIAILNLKQLNLMTWIFYYGLIVQSFMASLLVIYHLDNHYMISKIRYDETRLYGWLAVQYVILMLPLSMNFGRYVIGNKNDTRRLFQVYRLKRLESTFGTQDFFLRGYFCFLSCISLFSVVYVYYSISQNPFIAIFTLDQDSLAFLRQQNGRAFSGNVYVKNIFGLSFTPILSYIAYCYYRLSSNTFDKCWFFSMLTAAIMMLFYNLEKAPLIQYGLGFVFIAVLMGYNFNFKKQFFYGLSIIILLIGLYSFLSETSSIEDVLLSYNSGIVGRIILGQAAGTYFSFEYFPMLYDHLGFSSLSSFLPGDNSERSARLIMAVVNPRGIDEGRAGVINSLFIGEAWANFGIYGVIISPIIVGISIYIVYYLLIIGKKTPVKLALYVYFVFHLSVTGGFNDFLYNPSVLLVFLFFVFPIIFLKQINRQLGRY